MRALLVGAALLLGLAGAAAQAPDQAPSGVPEGSACPGLVASRPSLLHRASLAESQVGVTYIGHSTFLIESPGGVRIATDYNDYVRPRAAPDIATMNRAHSTHFTDRPDPGIKQVLRGWDPAGGTARHDLQLGDVRVRNVATNIRNWSGGTMPDGNSIFVFETAELCIAHLGHLHHTLEPGHLRQLGKIDVLLVPVDGNYTLDLDGMMEVLEAINAPLMLPMHYFGQATLERFLERVGQRFDVARSETAAITISRTSLPARPKVLVLPPGR